jgi:hypothetical protein
MKFDTALRSSKVADYYFVVGTENEFIIKYEGSTIEVCSFACSIIDRYPIQDKIDFPLLNGMHVFCMPKGLMLSNTHRRPTFHSFVPTSDRGDRKLGSCLTFYEPMTCKQLESFTEFVKSYCTSEQQADILKRRWWVPKCICLLSLWPFVYSFKQVLCQIFLMTFEPNSIPLERLICNFIDDVPAPPVGRVDITYYLGSSTISFRCPPLNQPHAWLGLPVNPLFECLNLQNIIALFSAVVSERHILYISSQYSLLTYCIEAITSFLWPLQWASTYIPILPLEYIGIYIYHVCIYMFSSNVMHILQKF